MELDLKGKVALVTGGSYGIGFRIASAFAEEGCCLGICGRDDAKMELALAKLREKGVDVVGVQADVTDPEQAANFVGTCANELGRIDVLVNNVGGSLGQGLLQSTDDEWEATFERNLFQVVRMIRLAIPTMASTGGGSIINIASISGWIPQLSGTLQYGAAKAALIYLTEPLALQLAEHDIRVNTVSPGSIFWEGGGWHRYSEQHPDSFRKYVEQGYPLQRLGRPEEIASTVVFLASSQAAWINGRHIPIDGLQQPYPADDRRLW